MEIFDLTGRVAVVTGGNRGIGLGLARGLAKAGSSVSVWSRDPERNRDAVAELESLGPAAGIQCDVADRASVDAAMAATVERFGRVDSLFANAGTSGGVRFEEMDVVEWNRVMDVNVTGVFHVAQAAARQMIAQGEGGSMAFTASLAAHFGLPTAPHYTASKGAVLQLAKSLAVRLARHRIRVNVISPGWIATEMTEEVQADEKSNMFAMARTPMRRWGEPADFEGAAVYLASSASSFMTGAELMIDG
ncbi:MAG TPA: glucose 1-dehydrogenase, partial [Acidimicrobiia bacterium]|nr:glucose 1-dehydrogenase [Acidimicrobiia bacterium]